MKKIKEVTERVTTSQVQIFTLRLWPETISASQVEWRGKIQHARSGEAHYLRGLQSLMDSLTDIVSRIDVPQPSKQKTAATSHRRRTKKPHRRRSIKKS
jgi:hypothetical protein